MSVPQPSKPWKLSQCTIPNRELLPEGQHIPPEVIGFLEDLSDLVREFVFFGTQVFEWSHESAAAITDEEEGTARVVVMNQFRWSLDVLLGIATQVQAGYCDTAKVHLRALLEARLGLLYMLESAVDRAHAFIACEQHRKLELLERLDPTTPSGAKHSDLLGSQGLALSSAGPLDALREEMAGLRNLIANPESEAGRKAFAEYARLVRKRSRPPWYSFFGGPNDMRRLAIHLKQGGTYDVLYRSWSSAVHSTDMFSRLRTHGRQVVAYHHLGYFGDAQEVAGHALNEGLGLIRGIVLSCAPGRQMDLQHWYETVRQQFLFVLSGHKVLMPLESPPPDNL